MTSIDKGWKRVCSRLRSNGYDQCFSFNREKYRSVLMVLRKMREAHETEGWPTRTAGAKIGKKETGAKKMR